MNSCGLSPSVLWHCWLGVGKSIRLVKSEWWGVGVVICLERSADCLHMVQLMPVHPKPSHLLPHLNPDCFYGTDVPRLSWKRARQVGVIVVVAVVMSILFYAVYYFQCVCVVGILLAALVVPTVWLRGSSPPRFSQSPPKQTTEKHLLPSFISWQHRWLDVGC